MGTVREERESTATAKDDPCYEMICRLIFILDYNSKI